MIASVTGKFSSGGNFVRSARHVDGQCAEMSGLLSDDRLLQFSLLCTLKTLII